jgi:membrane-bound lytic murein transglycosylase B
VTAAFDGNDLSRFNTAKLELNETVQSLRDKGVRFETTLPADAPALLIVAEGKDGPVYRVGFNNFYALTRYNRSPMYAMAVHDLGDAVMNFMRDATR